MACGPFFPEKIEMASCRLSGDTAHQATSPEIKVQRSEFLALKECVADRTLENGLFNKHDRGWGEPLESYWSERQWRKVV